MTVPCSLAGGQDAGITPHFGTLLGYLTVLPLFSEQAHILFRKPQLWVLRYYWYSRAFFSRQSTAPRIKFNVERELKRVCKGFIWLFMPRRICRELNVECTLSPTT